MARQTAVTEVAPRNETQTDKALSGPKYLRAYLQKLIEYDPRQLMIVDKEIDPIFEVTAIVDQYGVAVPGITVPIVLVHMGSGLYRAVLPTGGTFTHGRRYNATFSAIGTQGYHGQWEETLLAQTRRA